MTPEIKALYLKAAKVGHRSRAGRISNTAAVLLGVVPEHPDHARRQLHILARLTADLARALSDLTSHDRQTEFRAGDQRPTGGRS